MLIEEGLVAYLKANEGIAALVRDRIYPVILPQNTEYPAIVYQKISNIHEKSHQGSSGLARPRFQFSIWAPTYAQVKAVSQALHLALEGYKGLMGDVDVKAVLAQGNSDGYEPDLDVYAKFSDYFIWHEEEKP